MWIDFNDNGAFEASEKLVDELLLSTHPAFASSVLSIPYDAPLGVHRMRVRAVYNTLNFDPCSSYASGETHDYEVNILANSCFKPLDIQTSEVTKNSVVVNVNPNPQNAGPITYAYEVRESGAPGSGSVGLGASGVASTNPFTITGLQPLTKYIVYVRIVCSSVDMSDWVQADDSISTLCNYLN